MKKKKFMFFVQGEGRGHLTQAIAMQDILMQEGHEISAVVIGMSPRREIPAYVYQRFICPIHRLDSPNFVTDKHNKGIKVGASILSVVANAGKFNKSIRLMHEWIGEIDPDVILNFFDPLVGLYYLTHNCKVPHICVAHQYIYHHEDFQFPRGKFSDRFALKWFTGLTGSGAVKRLAISFYGMSPSKNNKIKIVPPLLRKELFNIKASEKDFYLVYLVNNGYIADVLSWHQQHPDKVIHCFTDKNQLPSIGDVSENFHVHQLDDKKFLELMAEAKALVTTAGFESVCEAMYLQKPVLMVPVQGHFEQYCNARDAFYAGAGIYSDAFHLQNIVEFASGSTADNSSFRDWVNSSQDCIYNELKSVLQ